MTTRLILASSSTIRAKLMRQAGYRFEVYPANVDEDAIKEKHMGSYAPEQIAVLLADAKATAVSCIYPEALVIGADQILNFQGELLNKVGSRVEAAAQLVRLAGNSHELISALSLAKGGTVLQSLSDKASLSLRTLTSKQIDHYLDQAGDGILKSVGCYQIEDFGIQLFERIEGDLFTVMGLPLIALRSALTRMGFDPLSAQPLLKEGQKQ